MRVSNLETCFKARGTFANKQDCLGNHNAVVVNALSLWHECLYGSGREAWEMATKLLGWAISFAESRRRPIWTQILVHQKAFFSRMNFREVGAFTLDLDNYRPDNCTRDHGTQEFVQMVYLPRSM